MRWRTEKEVKNGKGQFICGEKHCDIDKGLDSWEVRLDMSSWMQSLAVIA